MNILFTLFGGLILELALFALLGRIASVPLAVRALLAGIVPLGAYFLFIFAHEGWPGLDVAAIHIAIFLGTALLLFMFTQYRRQARGRMHWAPRLLIGFFLMLAVLNAVFLTIATNGLPRDIARWWLPHGDTVNTAFSGVVPHDQQAASAISAELSRRHAAELLGWRVDIDGLTDPAQAQQYIVVKAYDHTGLPISDLKVSMQVKRPGAPDPQTPLRFVAVNEGEYRAELLLPDKGRWLLELALQQDGKVRYQDSHEVVRP
jgi:nitrogen fixation protein FixH